MAYSYYQSGSGNQGWGTNQYQFGLPPQPGFQPQPSWGGREYYGAHAGQMADPSLWDHAWNRLGEYSETGGGMGVGLHEARHWHRKAYGGLGELNVMAPPEIGHAAAYEAYRTWIHHNYMREPLSGDWDRQREGLVGTAVAEATRLMQYVNRWDSYSRMLVSEAAAATASVLFYEYREREQGEYDMGGRGRSRSMSRHGSFSGSAYGGSTYAGSSYDDYDPYALDEQRYRGRKRGRSHSRHRLSGSYGSVMSGGGIPMPGQMGSQMGSAYGTQSSYGSSYGSPYAGGASVMNGSQYMPASMGSTYSQGVPMVIPQSSQRGRSHSRNRSNSMSVPYYANGTAMGGVMPYGTTNASPGVVIVQPSKHRHKHRKHSKHRSHSIGRMY